MLFALCFLTFLGICVSHKTAHRPLEAAPQELDGFGHEATQDAKQYAKAITTFQQMTYDFATTHYAMEAQFYLAETYLRKKEYAQAQLEFEFLVSNYPSSPFAEEAQLQDRAELSQGRAQVIA